MFVIDFLLKNEYFSETYDFTVGEEKKRRLPPPLEKSHPLEKEIGVMRL